MNQQPSTRTAVGFAVVFPTVVTWIYFVALAQQPAHWQQLAYGTGKMLQFAFPVLWLSIAGGPRLALARPRASGIAWGVAFGLVVAGAMLMLYHRWLAPAGWFEGAAGEAIRGKVAGLKIDAAWKFAGLGLFYSLIHSALEEYYWRWFVFRQLLKITSTPCAIAVSSLGFMAHHVLLVAHFFGWQSPATWLFSASVAVGGAAWAALYHRSGSLAGPWLSHLIVDATIFMIGYDVTRSVL